MVEFATFDDLDGFRQKLNEAQIIKAASFSRTNKTVFLAHSSKDKRYLPAIISILENHGGSVYVDKEDERLPESTNRETAEVLKSTIRDCIRFVLFVTTNSKDSRWVPWELGLADSEKGESPIALFPTATKSHEQQWTKQEYLGLYRRIVWGKIKGWKEKGWMVYDHLENTATSLRDWLKGG